MVPRIKVVLCGSFHRSPEMLRKQFLELEITGCRVLSPLSLDFDNDLDEFVLSKTEQSYSVEDIEKYHLKAIREADFVWLYAPDGYIGTSTAFELGFSYNLAVPIFSKTRPTDNWLASITNQVASVFDAIESYSDKS